MILTCPQCATRYLLPGQSLGPEGRRVKCSNCKEIWFQYPDDEEILPDSNQPPVVDIPEGVRPLQDGSNLPTVHDDGTGDPLMARKAKVMGYGASAGVFFVILGFLLALHGPISGAMPFTNSFYSLFGYTVAVPGQGLNFKELAADALPDSAGEKIAITGKIINETEKSGEVPMIEAQMRDIKGEVLERWAIRPPAAAIDGQSEISFSTDYLHATPGEAKNIQLNFIPAQN